MKRVTLKCGGHTIATCHVHDRCSVELSEVLLCKEPSCNNEPFEHSNYCEQHCCKIEDRDCVLHDNHLFDCEEP